MTFHDLAADPAAGIDYRRTESPSDDKFDAIKADPPYTFLKLADSPIKSRGAPGVAIFDFDGDGDQDIYVTNGPGSANSLYANQLVEAGRVGFIDVAASAAVTATDQDSTGVCYGDIDNDGDSDLLVLGNKEPNRLFENLGGTFVDVTATSGLGSDDSSSTSCSMGDVNLDGLLDIAVANVFDMIDQVPIFLEPFALNEHNQLFVNQGGGVFVDATTSAGIRALGLPDAPAGAATISWGVALVDIDLDGDIDLVHADDQAAIPDGSVPAPNAVDRGYIQIFENDGTGIFTNTTIARQMDRPGAWMGLAFGDYDRNGTLDIFATNFSNLALAALRGTTDFSASTRDSRWFLQRQNGTFRDVFEESGPIHSPFGWGASAADYDNDGDTDILYHGGLDQGNLVVTAPGLVLAGDGNGNFSRDTSALADSTNHVRRTVQGMAVGDLDGNGFVDIVSVSNFDIDPNDTLTPIVDLGGEFDEDAFVLETFTPDANGDLFFTGTELLDGTLSIELSSGGNGHRWVQVETQGSVGLVSGARVNRSGIGAVVSFTPIGGRPSTSPVLGGSSYASQDSLVQGFGLGRRRFGRVDVLWPGGVRNRLYGVRAGERVLFPEIPCSIDDPSVGLVVYASCVAQALHELKAAGVVDRRSARRFFFSAIAAFRYER